MTDPENDVEEDTEVDDIEEKIVRREVVEIRPENPSPEVNDPEPPNFSITGVIKIVKEKGLLEALSDDAWSPHVHLVMLLIIIFIIAISVAVIQLSIG